MPDAVHQSCSGADVVLGFRDVPGLMFEPGKRRDIEKITQEDAPKDATIREYYKKVL